MSIRVYSGPHYDGRRGPITGAWIPWLFAGLTIGGQIVWLLAPGVRDTLTILTVISFFLASASHAWLNRGAAWALAFVGISAGLGFAMEAIGLRVGLPFGNYAYAGTLGPEPFGVPIVVALAWSMMAYPCFLAARVLSTTRAGVVILGSIALAGWDLFLDPQMVSEGHWTWQTQGPALPGIAGIPFINFVGWFVTALLIMWCLDHLPQKRGADGVPTLMLLWVYCSNVLANIAFFGRPWVAVWGGIVMGIVVVPWAWITWANRP